MSEQTDVKHEVKPLAEVVGMLARRIAYVEGHTYPPGSEMSTLPFEHKKERPHSKAVHLVLHEVMGP